MGSQSLTWTVVATVSVALVLGAGCKDKRSGGKARCKRVEKGQRYEAVKRIFGRAEDARRGSYLAHTHTWKFEGGRCVVRFSGVAVSRDGTWVPRGAAAAAAAADKPRRPRSAALDCEAYVQRQKKCLDDLVKLGADRIIGGLKKRLGPLPDAQRSRKLAALEQTRAQLARLLRKQLGGPTALVECRRSYGKPRLAPEDQRKAQSIRRCLKLTDCAAFARCYWTQVSSGRVGGGAAR